MHAVLEQLRQAIQHALTLGLQRTGGLEPLRDALTALQSYEALTPLAESLRRALETPDTRVQLNELTRLHYACEQCLVHLNTSQLPLRSEALAHEPTRQVAAPHIAHAEVFASLFRGEVSLLQALPAIREQVFGWQVGAPLLPLQLTLAHSGTAYLAIEKLRSLGADVLPTLARLAQSKSPMVRLRACELLLEHAEPKATAALRGALRTAPRALPLFQTLRQRPDLHSLVLSDDAPPLEQWLNALHTREHLHQMLQRAETQIKLQPADSPAIRLLVGKLREFARSELDYWRVLARIPHEQATHALLAASGWLSVVGLEHLTTTLDYRLTPLILSVNRQFWTPDLTQLARLGDAAFLPYVLRARHPSLNRYGEPAEVVKSA